jgi:hypothetical protein
MHPSAGSPMLGTALKKPQEGLYESSLVTKDEETGHFGRPQEPQTYFAEKNTSTVR